MVFKEPFATIETLIKLAKKEIGVYLRLLKCNQLACLVEGA